MRRALLVIFFAVIAAGALGACAVTRDGARVAPKGAGTITIDAGTFEAFPLPDYAAKHVTGDTKSYFVEVEPGRCRRKSRLRCFASSTGRKR